MLEVKVKVTGQRISIIRPNKKDMCVSGYLFFKMEVRLLFFYFLKCYVPEVAFIKTELVYIIYFFQSFTWCHGSLLLNIHLLTI